MNLQTNHDLALKKLHQSNDDNKRLSKELQDIILLNGKLKESITNEKLITMITKSEQSLHNQQLISLRNTCQRLHNSNNDLIDEKKNLYVLNEGLKEALQEVRKACHASIETLSQAKIHHTNLVTSQNEITQKKDIEISNLMDKVTELQIIINSKSDNKIDSKSDNKSDSKSDDKSDKSDNKISDLGVEIGLESEVLINTTDNTNGYKLDGHESKPIDTNRPDSSKSDAHYIETPPSKILQVPSSKKVTFLNTISNTNDISSSSTNKRKSYEISKKDDNNNDDNTKKVLLCPLCYDHPYGLMTTCKQCTQQYHSSCAKKLAHYSKVAFICDSCHEQSSY